MVRFKGDQGAQEEAGDLQSYFRLYLAFEGRPGRPGRDERAGGRPPVAVLRSPGPLGLPSDSSREFCKAL